MDVRMFLEGDMKAFLDARLSVDYLKEQTQAARLENATTLFGKDYEKLLIEALNEHNIPKAKAVLHEVKDQFSAYPVGSPERQHLQALLHALYTKFKLHLEDETTMSKLETALDTIDSSPKTSAAVLKSETHGLQFGRAEGTDKEIEEALAAMDAVAKSEPNKPKPSPEAPKVAPPVFQHPDAEFMPPTTASVKKTPKSEAPPMPPPTPATQADAQADTQADMQESTQESPPTETPPSKPVAAESKKELWAQETPELPPAPELSESAPEKESPAEPEKEVAPEEEPEDSTASKPVSLFSETPESTTDSFTTTLQQLEQALQQASTKKAYWLYKEAKNQYTLLTREQQSEHHQTLINYYDQILAHMNQTASQSVLKPIEEDLVAAMKSGNLHEAMIHYEELRNEALQLPPALQEEYVTRMQEYYQWILRSWNEWRSDHHQNSFLEKHERRLSGKP